VRIGVALPSVGLEHDRRFILDVARAAEDGGLDSVWTVDHVVLPYERESRYPYQRSGTEVAFDPQVNWLDPLVTLSLVAGVTERVKLGTSILVLPYRNPVVVAGQVASLDVLSAGRFILGVGAGWLREEFEAIGVPPAERGARTDEGLEAMKVLWTQDPASFEGRFTSFSGIALSARPHTPGGPPIWVGGNTEPGLRRALRFGQAWHGMEVFAEDMPEIRETLARLGDEVGRDPAELELTVARGFLAPGTAQRSWVQGRRVVGGADPSTESILDDLGQMAEQGISMVLMQITVDPPAMPEAVGWLASEILPEAERLEAATA
jgi:probable F420-dependent oxidoreductase